MATRRVTVLQEDEPLLVAIVSFHENPPEPEVAAPCPDGPRPDELPLLQHWAHDDARNGASTAALGRAAAAARDPHVGEPPTFLGGHVSERNAESHWMRLPRDGR